MAFENFPAALQQIFQQGMLARRFESQLTAKNAYRKTAFRLPVPVRSGESITYSRAGRIAPTLDDILPSSNTGLDNGVTAIGGVGGGNTAVYPFEQWSVSIGMSPKFIDLNLVQEQEVIANLFKQNVDNLAQQAALSLDLRVMATAFTAYTSGSSYSTGAETASDAHVHMDNVVGLDTAFATSTMVDGVVFPTGAPTAVSGGNPLNVTIIYADGTTPVATTIIGVTYDNPNTSLGAALRIGKSGIVQLGAVPAKLLAKGDVITALDAPVVLRPNGRLSADAIVAGDTIGAQLIINAVNDLRAEGVESPLADGTYPCYIDPLVDAQFFTDQQYQIMSQGTVDSTEFKGGRLNRNFGVTFVKTTNSPAFKNAQGVPIRHAIITGEKYVQQSPFAGTVDAIRSMPDMGVSKFDVVDDIVFVNRMPLDRAGQILSMGWYYIGGYAAPTDATINSTVIPSASDARYKRARVLQVAAAR